MTRLSVVLGLLVSLLNGIAGASEDGESRGMALRENWSIQSSALVHADGAAISTVGFQTSDWYPAAVPTTVLSALVEDKVYPDPYNGMNLRSIPGTSYPIFEDFSTIMMPPNSPFKQSWWYRTEFKLPADFKGKTVWLGFDGINYRANVWLNGVSFERRPATT
jgi:exo-1,4-beta-D-glucosaminidase